MMDKDKVVVGFITLGIAAILLYGLIYANEQAVIGGAMLSIIAGLFIGVWG